MQNTDTGSNGGSHDQPNMDSVAEVKVLTSNYQAEYGRNSAGTINVIIKSGTQDFHGSGFWFYRHESLYANNFFSNRTRTPRPINRINNAGYTIGGPIYIPGKFNRNKDKLFFFFSQEYVRRQNYPGTQWATTPTELERDRRLLADLRSQRRAHPHQGPRHGPAVPRQPHPQGPHQRAGADRS